ncbi:helix-turn-helix transcriptional regulator [Roseinatronobacter sp.]|uniref:helix-turn-helix transcriptional regulator n=1 Tax=Roseinatronobacter sp. TaxID=1945755 RepID=UPI0025EC56F0|nr:helix-turn-helix domain-containing protein [Roseibaca sp.]
MRDTGPSEESAPTGVLGGWISRLDLALELGLTVDTLRRWEKRRFGPPAVRAGRQVYYRRDAVKEWLQQQEQSDPRRPRAGGRR